MVKILCLSIQLNLQTIHVMKKFNHLWIVLIPLVGFWAAPSEDAVAHQQKEAYTTLSFNARSQSLEIIHRFYIHDAEHALTQFLQIPVDLLTDRSAQAQFGTYVSQHFYLQPLGTKTSTLDLQTQTSTTPISTQFVGQEIEGKYIWVYQEVNRFTLEDTKHNLPEAPSPYGLRVKMTALQELWPRQTNQVSIDVGQHKHPSIRLTIKDNWRELYF